MFDTRRLVCALPRALAGLGLFLVSGVAAADYALNFQRPVTEIAADLYDLHMLIFWVCVVIFVVVFTIMFYAVFSHRKSRGAKAASFHESTTLEVIWTVIPFVILIGMAIPSTRTLLKMEDTTGADMTVNITAYQWKWEYEYPDSGVHFFSTLATPRAQILNQEEKGEHYLLEVDNELVLPVGRKIRFSLTANDVIHAWWVPQLGVKKDAIPGFINEMWTRIDEPGVYRGQCAELCGKDHGFMPIVVRAVAPAEFDAWVAAQKGVASAEAAQADKTWSREELIARGEKVYAQCAACHGPTGQGVPNVFPAIAGSAIATGPVDGHLDRVMNGKPGTAMQAFAEQLNDIDIAAVVTFQRNAFGNSVGDSVQPSDVKARRQ
ncbi:MAG: cytochrome c oxidase subunit II [Gammaproteobacteria bacterium]|jgi:cytochrome c oxidase subunit 2|nr:cytochrome c oxidase subunit II [Gammaproteobacteria bacterium]